MTFIKDPDAVEDYVFNWLAELDDDTIATSVWVVPVGITKDSDSNDDSTTTVWLSGGSAGAYYQVTNRITTVGGRTLDRTATFIVRQQ